MQDKQEFDAYVQTRNREYLAEKQRLDFVQEFISLPVDAIATINRDGTRVFLKDHRVVALDGDCQWHTARLIGTWVKPPSGDDDNRWRINNAQAPF